MADYLSKRGANIAPSYATTGDLPTSTEVGDLVFVGGQGWLMDDFSELIKKLKLDEWVHLPGYITDEELIWLYKNCFANLAALISSSRLGCDLGGLISGVS